METKKIPLEDVSYFSSTFHAYISQNEKLKPFYRNYASVESAGEQMEKKQFPADRRSTLCQVLREQYADMEVPESVSGKISLLEKDNCYTVVTGHQLNLFTGPLYVILKMITTINACEELKKAYPDKEFVPVYWMASEDHDFEEINHFHFNGSTYKWDTDQSGAVGRFTLDDIKPLLAKVAAFPPLFLKAYQGAKTLSEAVRHYMNSLFGDYGLVVLDADDRRLKKMFTEVMRDDILNNSIQPLVDNTSERLDSAGFKTQVNARQINFFYLEDDLRLRIENTDSGFTLVDGDRDFSREEMETIISDTPEKLSPNVILRPVYEEMILPNLAYCGGPSELIYWLQLTAIFEKYDLAFPMLLPRNFAMIIPQHLERKWNKTRCSLNDLFLGKHDLHNKIAMRDSQRQVELNGQKQAIEKAFEEIREQALSIDPTMSQHVEAQWARTENRLDIIQKKFIRAEKRHHEDTLRQAEDVFDQLFPGGGLQERHDNIINFMQTDPDIVKKLKEMLSPFDYRFNVIHYGE